MASKRKCLRNVNRETLLVESHHPEVSGTIRRFCATQGPVFALSQHVIDTTRFILSTYRVKHGLKTYRSPSVGMYAVVFALHLCTASLLSMDLVPHRGSCIRTIEIIILPVRCTLSTWRNIFLEMFRAI